MPMLDAIKTALDATGIAFAMYGWATAPRTDYGVISLESAGAYVSGDDHMQMHAVEGTVDLYCHNAGETQRKAVQTALNSVDGLSWYFNSTQYEADTRLVHFEWVFQFAETI